MLSGASLKQSGRCDNWGRRPSGYIGRQPAQRDQLDSPPGAARLAGAGALGWSIDNNG
jgi:hypothetical protein